MFGYLNKKKALIAQSGDTMTIPSHTGLGLFIASAQLTHDLCREYKINGVFGFPSPPSYRTFKKKLNWKFNENLIKYTFKVPAVPVAYIAQKIRVSTDPVYVVGQNYSLILQKSGLF